MSQADLIGRLISEPIGDRGLKVDDSREIVRMAQQGSVGDKPPVVIVGPLDRATPEAADALLKTLEDLAEGQLRIILWADYLIGVSGTLRSRALLEWCPPKSASGWSSLYAHLNGAAHKLCEAALHHNIPGVLSILEENADQTEALLDALSYNLAERACLEDVGWLWVGLREALGAKWLGSRTAVAGIFLEGVS